jgi:transcriptional regulator with XRE-family HTH domain
MPLPDTQLLVGRPPFASALRRHRISRRLSQLELSLECGISARHLSFLETGRAQPSRDMVMQLADGLMLPLGIRNELLQTAGFSAAFPVSQLDSEALKPFREMLSEMISRHAPHPAMVCDRHWNILDANPAAAALLSVLGDGSGQVNAVRILTDNPAAAETIANLPDVLNEMSARIRLEAMEAGDDGVLLGHLAALESACARHPAEAASPRSPIVPLMVNSPLGQLRFLSTVAHFGTSEDVTIRDLRLELLFPVDDTTRQALAHFA